MIDATEVDKIFTDCFWTQEEIDAFKLKAEEESQTVEEHVSQHSITLDGVMVKVAFNPEKVSKHEGRIKEILAELHPTFAEGASFLRLPFDAKEHQWGEHQNAEQLMLLGMSIGKMKFAISDRVFWEAMPGGMPYIIADKDIYDAA